MNALELAQSMGNLLTKYAAEGGPPIGAPITNERMAGVEESMCAWALLSIAESLRDLIDLGKRAEARDRAQKGM